MEDPRLRRLVDRADALRARLRGRSVPAPATQDSLLVQVYDGGAMPTSVPRVFMCKPVSVSGAEAQGVAGTVTAGPAGFPVVVLGPGVPAAGDLLVADRVGNRWVAELGGTTTPTPTPTNPCGVTWPRVLTCAFRVDQSQSSFYFNNFPAASYPLYAEPLSPYTLTYGPRPAAIQSLHSSIPGGLLLSYFSNPPFVGTGPPYYITVPDFAWFSGPIAIVVFGTAMNCYFYLWFKGCQAVVMVIDDGYETVGGSPSAVGAGNNTKSYVVTQAGGGATPFQMRATTFSPTVSISGTHGSDDIVPDAFGNAGFWGAYRSGPP